MRRNAIAVAVVFGIALFVRLTVIAQLLDEPLFRSPQLDGLEYLNWGSRIALGDFAWPADPIHGPGYPLFVGLVLAIARTLSALHVLQAVLGSIAAVLLMVAAARMYGAVAGIAAGIFYAICAPLVLIEVSFLAESILMPALVAALFTGARRPVASGLLLGFATIVRPTAAILVPLFGWLIARDRGSRVIAFLIAAAIPIVPVLVLNTTTGGSPAIQRAGGMNFYIGNSPLHDGTGWARPGGDWDLMRGTAWRAGVRGAASEDRYFLTHAIREIGSDPLAWLRLLGSKAIWLTQDEEIRDTHSFHFFAASSSLLRALPGYGIFFALACAGFFIAAREKGLSPLLTGYTLLIALTVIGLIAGSRYRAPIVPALIIYGALAVAWMAGKTAQRDRRALIAPASIFVVALALSQIRTHAPSHDFAEETAMSALALRAEGNLPAAQAMAQRAVS
ncbi:MAG TPA: hypothetical protein VF057_13545, partial [Thermoanaerobaculia bacterium]